MNNIFFLSRIILLTNRSASANPYCIFIPIMQPGSLFRSLQSVLNPPDSSALVNGLADLSMDYSYMPIREKNPGLDNLCLPC